MSVIEGKKATRRQLCSLYRELGARRVTLVELSQEVNRPISWLSEVSRGLLPNKRVVTVEEYQAIKDAIKKIGQEKRK